MKRGLKPTSSASLAPPSRAARGSPMKRGLKHRTVATSGHPGTAARGSPMKRGLKLVNKTVATSSPGSRARLPDEEGTETRGGHDRQDHDGRAARGSPMKRGLKP